MGESVVEATLTKWLKEVGDPIEVDDVIVEIATDKVDSDVPSEVTGILIEKKFSENDVVQIGEVMAVIQTDGDTPEVESAAPAFEEVEEKEMAIEFEPVAVEEPQDTPPLEVPTYALQDPSPEFEKNPEPFPASSNANEFYSPLVKSIARAEQISAAELKQIKGTGKNNRITKKDVLSFLEQKRSSVKASSPPTGVLSKA